MDIILSMKLIEIDSKKEITDFQNMKKLSTKSIQKLHKHGNSLKLINIKT